MDKKVEINITTKIQSIELDEFVIAEISKEQQAKIDVKKITFEFSLNVQGSPEKKEILIRDITKMYSDETKSVYLGELVATGVFEIINYEEIALAHQGIIPVNVITMFAGILVATTRGMLLMQVQNTFLKGAIIPIINPSSFFTQQPQASIKK